MFDILPFWYSMVLLITFGPAAIGIILYFFSVYFQFKVTVYEAQREIHQALADAFAGKEKEK